MVAPAPIAWDVVENAIHSWFSSATGLTSIWRDQSGPQPNYPFGSLLIIAGPVRLGGVDEYRYTTNLKRVLNVKVTPIAQANTKYTVKINSVPFEYTSDATPTVAEITAGLVSLINLGSEPVTATDNGTDFDIVGDGGVRFSLELTDDYDGNQMSFANNDLGHEVKVESGGQREITVSCQAYVAPPDSRDPTKNAKHLMSLAQSSLGMPSYLATLRESGIAVIEDNPVQNIDEIIEDAYFSRANMDVRFGLAGSVEDYTGYIKTVEITSTDLGIIDEIFGDI